MRCCIMALFLYAASGWDLGMVVKGMMTLSHLCIASLVKSASRLHYKFDFGHRLFYSMTTGLNIIRQHGYTLRKRVTLIFVPMV